MDEFYQCLIISKKKGKCDGILLSHKRKEVMPFAAIWKDLEKSKVRQRKTNIWYHLYVNSKKKKDKNELIYRRETDSQTLKTNLGLTKRTGGTEGGIGGLAYVHYCIWDDGQQGPAYSTGNSTRYSVTIYMGKESEKEWICV